MYVRKYMEMLGIKDMPLELCKYLSTPSLLRLKNVGYFCGMDYASLDVYDFREKVSRYDHSLTVALLTWKLTHDLKATLAGLFHDISTPCFSHVIDYMNKDYDKQESTEEKTEDIIRKDKYLLDCLFSDGISVEEIVDFKKYSIVDLDRPMLCSDRLDGVILTGLLWTKSLNLDDVKNIIDDLLVTVNEYGQYEISLKSLDIAKLLVDTSLLIDVYCHSKEDNYMMELLAYITKRAIDIGIVSYDELFVLDEKELMNRFDNSFDMELLTSLYLFRNVDVKDIPNIDIPSAKVRKLNPIVRDKRFML